ncbi:hypothetical protein LshimejAT787_1104350 [Lyophyllum shimeji]|uniref:Uncharacterized protein n=1 Tax=Lyophyllum shimeji TaxID=47721 RepID=A0A9P3PTA0_LYOSH|nr:hypothetical protein LshimejAT787_1104350 [Lyophyllum shimeji]
MTPKDRSLLQVIGRVFLFDVGPLVALSVLYGIFILLVSIAVVMFIQGERKSRPAWIMFIITLTTFVLGTVYWASFLEGFVYKIQASLVDDLDQPLDDARLDDINTHLFTTNTIQNWVSQLTPFISDGIVVWRAWVLFAEQRSVLAAPIVLLIAGTALSITYSALTSTFAASLSAQFGENTVPAKIYHASLALSLATNAGATLLIPYKLRTLRESFRGMAVRGSSPVQRVMILLVESGALFCMLQVVTVALVLVPFTPFSPTDVGGTTMLSMYYLFCAMYPTAVMILVKCQQSVVETFGLRSGGLAAFDANIEDIAGRKSHPNFTPGSEQEQDDHSGRDSSSEKALGLPAEDCSGDAGRHAMTAPF